MKKSYILTCTILLMAVLAKAQTTSTTPTFVITEMKVPAEQEGVIYNETKYNAQIEVKLRNVTPQLWEGSFNIHCLTLSSFTDYPYFTLVNPNGNVEGDHSFIEIHNLGVADIERVEFVLGSTGQSSLVCAPSIDGTDYFNNPRYELEEEPWSVYMPMTIIGTDDVCDAGYTFNVPNTILAPDGSTMENTQKLIKYIRLNWGADFSGTTGNDLRTAPDVYAIKVYTNADLTVGIDEANNASLSIQVIGRNLQVSELADVVIYDITGKLVAQYASIEDTYLDSLKSGVYVVVASGKNEQKTIQKVLIK